MKRITALIVALALLITSTLPVFADNGEYLVLGADLTPQEQATVLKLLGVKDINDYNVSYITNQEEHEALGSYLPPEVIGNRALSSVLLKSNRGGINVDTQNINYVTKEMYQNALITAGLKNVDMQVAGPTSISGTAALVAATKAYEIMTGETVNPQNVDTANQELVVTQDLANEVGEKDATELVAALKQQVAENDYTPEQISQALDSLEEQMGLNISPGTKEQIIDLMDKVSQIDIDPEAIKNQAQNIYNSIQGYVTGTAGQGFFDRVTQMVKNFLDTIFNFFSGNKNQDNSGQSQNTATTTDNNESENNTANSSDKNTGSNDENNKQESSSVQEDRDENTSGSAGSGGNSGSSSANQNTNSATQNSQGVQKDEEEFQNSSSGSQSQSSGDNENNGSNESQSQSGQTEENRDGSTQSSTEAQNQTDAQNADEYNN